VDVQRTVQIRRLVYANLAPIGRPLIAQMSALKERLTDGRLTMNQRGVEQGEGYIGAR